MDKMSKIQMRKEKGITLIALVVSIVVLIMLSGVTLSLTIGENGIVAKAQEAVVDTNHSTVFEALGLEQNDYKLNAGEGVSFIEYLQNKGIIDENNIVNASKLLGKSLSTGNGSGSEDVYVIVENEENETYELKYFGKTSSSNKNLGKVGYVTESKPEASDVSIFDFDPSTGAIALKNAKALYTDHYTGTGEVSTLTTIVVPEEIDGVKVTKIGMENTCKYDVTWNDGSVHTLTGKYYYGINSPYVEKIVLPDTITELEKYAFYNCSNLKTVNLPSSIKSISEYAFESCTSLSKFEIPSNITEIKRCAFENCTSLSEITIPNSVTYIGGAVFENCTSLNKIEIPDSVSSIGSSVFYNCTSLETVRLSENIKSIESVSFAHCTSLKSLTIPKSVTNIGIYVFYGCTNLNVTVEAGSTLTADSFKNSEIDTAKVTFAE